MAPQNRPSGKEPGSNSREEEVVRLPVSDRDLSQDLDVMPSPQKISRMQPTVLDLFEAGVEEGAEPTTADLGIEWDEEDRAGSSTPMGWLVLIGVMLVILGGWAMMKLVSGEASVAEASQHARDELNQDEREHQDALVLLTRVENLVVEYLKASDIERKASFVRHQTRVLPLMRDYYQRHELKPAKFETLRDFHAVGVGNYPFFFLSVKVEGERAPLVLFAEQLANGDLQFDWESEVSYQPMGISEYLEKKPTEAMDFRVYARLDTFLGYEFSDGDRYQPLMLTFRDTDEFLFGYIDKDNPEEAELTEYLGREVQARQPFLLRLRFLPNTQSRRSVLVEKVLAPRWVYIEQRDEEPTP
jgi:hypothetical protein